MRGGDKEIKDERSETIANKRVSENPAHVTCSPEFVSRIHSIDVVGRPF